MGTDELLGGTADVPIEPIINAGVRTFDAIVLGAGPGGAATSLFLHDPTLAGDAGRSLRSLLVDVRPAIATRDNVVLLQPEVVDRLHDLGVADAVFPAERDTFVGAASGKRFGVASIARLENALRAKVAGVGAEHGIEAAYESTLEGVRRLPDQSIEAVLVHHDGSRETVRAAAIIDATGGRSGLLDPGSSSEPRYFLTGHLPFRADHEAYARTELPPIAGEHAAPWFLEFNHSLDGASAFVQVPEQLAHDLEHAPERQAATFAGYLRRADGVLRPGGNSAAADSVRGVHLVTSTTNLPPAAAADGVYAVGESAGRGSPIFGNGIKLALEDAAMAAAALRNVVDPGLPSGAAPEEFAAARDEIEQQYSAYTRFMHGQSTAQPPALG